MAGNSFRKIGLQVSMKQVSLRRRYMHTVRAYGLPIAKRILVIAVTQLVLDAVTLEALAERFKPGCCLPFRDIAQERPIDLKCAASVSATLAGLRIQDKL